MTAFHPSAAGYVVEWVFFTLVSLLPLAAALVMLVVAPDRARRTLESAEIIAEKWELSRQAAMSQYQFSDHRLETLPEW